MVPGSHGHGAHSVFTMSGYDMDEKELVISENRAKQGRGGIHVLVILVVSLGLAAIAAVDMGLV
jgi:hypothetical protein